MLHMNCAMLDTEIRKEDLYVLAVHFDEIEPYIDILELNASEKSDVRRTCQTSGTAAAMTKCLSIWHNHKLSSATFSALLTILLKLKKESVALEVGKYLKNRVDSDSNQTN